MRGGRRSTQAVVPRIPEMLAYFEAAASNKKKDGLLSGEELDDAARSTGVEIQLRPFPKNEVVTEIRVYYE